MREIDRLVGARIEDDQDPGGRRAGVLERVAIALRDVADVAGGERRLTVAAARAEERGPDRAGEDVLPLVGVGMPVELAERPGGELEDDAGHRRGNRKVLRLDAPLPAPRKRLERILREKLVPVGMGRRLDAAERRGSRLGGQRALGEVDLLGGKVAEGLRRKPEVLGEEGRGHVSEPIGEAERAEFGEVAVVEDEDEVAGFVAEALEHVAVAAGEVPDVARGEVVDAASALRIDDRGSHPATDDKRPFGGGRMPVELAHHPRLEPHRHAGDPLRDRQLLDRRLLAVAAAEDTTPRLLQGKGELGERVLGEKRVGDVVHERRIAGDAA